MNMRTTHLAATALSMGLIVGSAISALSAQPRTQDETVTNQSPYSQALGDLGSCMMNQPAAMQRKALIGLLISQNYADDSLYRQPDELVINLAKQYVVGFCGPDAWGGE